MTAKTKKKVHESHNYECFYCGKKLIPNHPQTTVDHIIPKDLGGTNCAENLLASCSTCNAEKSNLLPSEYIIRLEHKISQHKKAIKRRKAIIKRVQELLEKEESWKSLNN